MNRSPKKHSRSAPPTSASDDPELHNARRASSLRVLDIWSQLAQRYSLPLDQDDIVDLRNETFIKDRGILRGTRSQYQFGCFADGNTAADEDNANEGPADPDGEDDFDELDAFAPGANIMDEIEKEMKKIDVPPMTRMSSADAEDLREFLEVEERTREELGDPDEDSDEVVDFLESTDVEEASEEEEDTSGEEGSTVDSADELSLPSDPPSTLSRQSVSVVPSDEESEDELARWDEDEAFSVYPASSTPSPQKSDSRAETPQTNTFLSLTLTPPRPALRLSTPSPRIGSSQEETTGTKVTARVSPTSTPSRKATLRTPRSSTPNSYVRDSLTRSPQTRSKSRMSCTLTPLRMTPPQSPRPSTPIPRTARTPTLRTREIPEQDKRGRKSLSPNKGKARDTSPPESEEQYSQEFEDVESIGDDPLSLEPSVKTENNGKHVEVFIETSPPAMARRGRKRKRVVSSEVDTASPGSSSQSHPYHPYPPYPYAHPHSATTPSPSHGPTTQSHNAQLPPAYLPQSPLSLPPLNDRHAQIYIAHAMQYLATYLMQSSASNAWPPPPIPPLHADQNVTHPHWPSSASNWQIQTPPYGTPEIGRPALVSRSRSRGRRVSFKLEEEVIPINTEEDKSQSEDDLVGKRETAAVFATTEENLGDDVVKVDTPRRRGSYSRAQTPGPPSRDVTPSPSPSVNRKKLSPRKR